MRKPQHCDANLLISRMPEAVRQELKMHAIVELDRGQLLFDIGDPVKQIYFPHTSVISLLVSSRNGDSVDVATVGCEGMIGYSQGVAEARSYSRQLVQVAGTATVVDRKSLLQTLSGSPALRELFARYVDAFSIQVMQSVACNALHSTEERFARWLLMTADRSPTDDISLTHEFVAEMLAVRRPTVTLIARSFQQAGLISTQRGQISIADRAGLQLIACECYAIVRSTYDKLLDMS